ncbi:MAG: cysteine--tRNA ligase [Spirochaetaceae bacterium]|jgi:cysteinyl-tRNA synthetase|nr:cysteine--tRNA ligase [Spirochaetaceae bacterium]
MPLSLYNTLGRKIETFTPINEGKVGFYGCGPTVYNYAHIGNLRAYVTHDILVRTLRRFGYEVTHVMNVTDVGHLSGDDDTGDDKMVKSAEERGKSVLEVAAYYTEAFFNDTGRLRIQRPDIVCKATEHIADMVALIKRIEAAGYTYSSGGNLYFDIAKFPRYGELGGPKPDEQKLQSRTELDGNKRNQGDFVLWFTRSKFENQALTWDSPWGRGYPGWHIECSAMSMKYLGEQFDIHSGGIDHIQIHHTNEIAQSEAGTGKHPWVRYWVHNEFLVLDKDKMSKSGGSFITLQDLVEAGFDPLDYRYFLLGGHYRNQIKFSVDSLTGAQNARKSLLSNLRSIDEKSKGAGGGAVSTEAAPTSLAARVHIEAFDAALQDDLNTPRALSALWGLVKDGGVPPKAALEAAFQMGEVLGLDLEGSLHSVAPGGMDRAEVEALVAERAGAKAAKNFARADEIRGALKARGVILEDGPEGTVWRYG